MIVRVLFPDRSRKLFGGFSATVSLHPKVPHWYLAFVGVEPRQQAKGVGRQLLAPVLELADHHGAVCYLETPFPGTLDFYRRLGFVLEIEARPFENAPPIWTMTRQPSPPRALTQ
jgi:GNAT superfamily N-acetyltransferase